MKKNIKVINTILIVVFAILFLLLMFNVVIKIKEKSIKEYTKSMFYMDTHIYVKVYSNKNANKVLEEVDNIYKEYNILCDKYNLYDYNINYINNNIGDIVIDEKLYKLIEYAKSWYTKSNGLLNINMGSVIDVWHKYRTNENGIPTIDELKNSGSYDINDIILKDNNTIVGGVNIDLGAVAKGYVTELVGKFLNDKGYNKYLINAGGNVLLGEHYSNDLYKIGIQSPFDNNSIIGRVKLKNKALVTSGGYERYYLYNDIKYHHIINPNTLYPPSNMASVTVISDSSSEADCLSTTLFLMTIEEGMEYIKDFDVDVIWVTLDGEVIKTDGVELYE